MLVYSHSSIHVSLGLYDIRKKVRNGGETFYRNWYIGEPPLYFTLAQWCNSFLLFLISDTFYIIPFIWSSSMVYKILPKSYLEFYLILVANHMVSIILPFYVWGHWDITPRSWFPSQCVMTLWDMKQTLSVGCFWHSITVRNLSYPKITMVSYFQLNSGLEHVFQKGTFCFFFFFCYLLNISDLTFFPT